MFHYAPVLVLVLGIGIGMGQYYWVLLGALIGIVLTLNTITREPLEISSRNFQGIILWPKGLVQVRKWLSTGAQAVIYHIRYSSSCLVLQLTGRIFSSLLYVGLLFIHSRLTRTTCNQRVV